MTDPTTQAPLREAHTVIEELGLVPGKQPAAMQSSHSSSLPIVCESKDGRTFLLKYFIPMPADTILPAGAKEEDFARREAGFYRYLDSVDPDRRELATPRTIMVGPGDPPKWLLLEWLPMAVGPREEVLSQDHVFRLLEQLQNLSIERLLGRRDFPVQHWDPVSYLDRIRLMYDAVLYVLGEQRWRHLQVFFDEAIRWTDGRKPTLVHGDFCEENIIVNGEDQPFLIDFERVGIGNIDHDLAWFWIHSGRSQQWKKDLLSRWLSRHVGGDRIRSEWGIRSALALLAIQRLRWGYLKHGDEDPRQSANLALLDAVMAGGRDLFPI